MKQHPFDVESDTPGDDSASRPISQTLSGDQVDPEVQQIAASLLQLLAEAEKALLDIAAAGQAQRQ